MAEEIIDSLAQSFIKKSHHNRWLMLIAAFKLAQALLFVVALASVCNASCHHDLPDLVLRWKLTTCTSALSPTLSTLSSTGFRL